MSRPPKTIQIFLPAGDPRDIHVAEITTRSLQVIEMPRSLPQGFLKMPESNQAALYFLFDAAEDGTEQKFYLGQTDESRARLGKHHGEKEFLERSLLLLISRTNSLTQTRPQRFWRRWPRTLHVRGLRCPKVLDRPKGNRAILGRHPGHRQRMRLLAPGVMREDGDSAVIVKDHLFSSASETAQALMGRTANVWGGNQGREHWMR
jgi:hypothetical protein